MWDVGQASRIQLGICLKKRGGSPKPPKTPHFGVVVCVVSCCPTAIDVVLFSVSFLRNRGVGPRD